MFLLSGCSGVFVWCFCSATFVLSVLGVLLSLCRVVVWCLIISCFILFYFLLCLCLLFVLLSVIDSGVVVVVVVYDA